MVLCTCLGAVLGPSRAVLVPLGLATGSARLSLALLDSVGLGSNQFSPAWLGWALPPRRLTQTKTNTEQTWPNKTLVGTRATKHTKTHQGPARSHFLIFSRIYGGGAVCFGHSHIYIYIYIYIVLYMCVFVFVVDHLRWGIFT